MMTVFAAIETAPGLRCFYVSADDQLQAERLLREAYPDLGDLQLYMMAEPFSRALHLQPKDVMEWHVGRRIGETYALD